MIDYKDVLTPKVIIRPKGVNSIAWLVFNTIEEKNIYVKREAQFCAVQQDAYMISPAKLKDERMKALMDKRVDFAQANNFAPLPENLSYWVQVTDFPKAVA